MAVASVVLYQGEGGWSVEDVNRLSDSFSKMRHDRFCGTRFSHMYRVLISNWAEWAELEMRRIRNEPN